AITSKGSSIAGRVCFWGSVAVGILVGRATGHLEDMPALLSIFLGFCTGFVTMILATILFILRKRAILRPLLAPLPRSAELLFPVGPRACWPAFRWLNRAAHG